MDQSKKMAKIACLSLAEKKAEDVRVIDISKVSTIADYFIIANGTNKNQVQTLIDTVQDDLFKAGYESKQVEGYGSASWVLLDYGDIIVHIFSKEDRLFYDLERIWRDGTSIDVESLTE